MLNRLHGGHILISALALTTLILGLRAATAGLSPMPELPPFSAPALADKAHLARFDAFFPTVGGTGQDLPVTALPFSLHGLRADSATGRGSAIIATGDGAQTVFGVGDTLASGVTLAAIYPDHVVLDRSGTREALWLDVAASSGPVLSAESLPAAAAEVPNDPPFDEAPPSVLPDDPAASPETQGGN